MTEDFASRRSSAEDRHTVTSELAVSRHALARQYDVALLDLDGVVYLGDHPVAHAVSSLAVAASVGMRCAYVTNNAARSPTVVAHHLRDLGIACVDDDVITSAQAAARLVAACVEPGATVLVVGGDGLREALAECGLKSTDAASNRPAAVVQGFSPDLNWRLLAEGSYALQAGIPWFASNLDATVPTLHGAAPGNGTFVSALAVTSGRRPVVAGKPERALFDEVVIRTAARRPLVVGDRLDTDIEGAVNAEMHSLLVFSGVTSASDVVLARVHQRPTYLGRDLRALLEPPHLAVLEGDVWRCGRWASLVESARVLVVPVPGDPSVGDDAIDAVTAACAAGWAYEGALTGVDGLPLDLN